jgi:hypothetical protein
MCLLEFACVRTSYSYRRSRSVEALLRAWSLCVSAFLCRNTFHLLVSPDFVGLMTPELAGDDCDAWNTHDAGLSHYAQPHRASM